MPLSKIRCPWEGPQQLESITWQGKSVCCICVWPLWQLLGTMEEKDCKVAHFLNCSQIFKPPLPRFTQTFPKVSVIKPEIKIFSLEATGSVEAHLDKRCCMLWGVLCFSFNLCYSQGHWLVCGCFFMYTLNIRQNLYMTEAAFFRDRLELLNSEPRGRVPAGTQRTSKSVHFQLRNTALGFASFRKEEGRGTVSCFYHYKVLALRMNLNYL